MLKKITLSLMVSVLCIEQSFAGTGSSTPHRQDQEDQPMRRSVPAPRTAQKPTPSDHSNDNGKAVLAGLAALTIGSGIAYALYQSSQEPEPSRKPSGRKLQGHDNFSYANENFSEEAWRKDRGLPNRFPTANPQRGYERPCYSRKNLREESESSSDVTSSYSASSSYSQTEESSESLDRAPERYKGCPVINLRDYDTVILRPEAAGKIDLHPVYNPYHPSVYIKP